MDFRKVAELRKQLPASVFLVTAAVPANEMVGIPEGQVVELTANAAAIALLKGTHVRATDEQIEKHRDKLSKAAEEYKAREHAAKQMYALPPEMEAMAKAFLQGAGAQTKKKE